MNMSHLFWKTVRALSALVLLSLLQSGPLMAAPASAPAAVPAVAPAAALPDHAAFDALLKRVVQMPGVDYAALKAGRAELDAYISELGRTAESTLAASSRNAQLAFWINAYNACMLKRVVDNYPIRPGGAGLFGGLRNRAAGYPDNSVWQIRQVFTAPHCTVAGAERSQDEIEHEIIRPRFGDPRIHFAVNCAARSCPLLWPEAFTEARLDEQLDRAVTTLMGNRAHFRLDAPSGAGPAVLTLNKVLDWYKEDFGGVDGLRAFFAGYVDGTPRVWLQNASTQVRFFEYDWTLNDVR
jgi:hypothetical protein